MFELKKSFTFEAGHILKDHDGKCKRPHGHSYTVIIHVCSDKLQTNGPKTNMVIDFYDISTAVKPMIEKYFDHHWLNETLQCEWVTVEFISKWIYEYLEPKLPHLHAVTIQETATSSVTYRKSI